MLQPAAFDLVSAALRHARDAEWLASKANPNRSPDQAYHLAGYGPECARKATVRAPWLYRTIGHRFDPASETVLDVAVALDPLALRYEPRSWAFDRSVTGSTTSRSPRAAEKTKLVPPASRVRTTRGSSA